MTAECLQTLTDFEKFQLVTFPFFCGWFIGDVVLGFVRFVRNWD